jgi:hypothetical protein
LARGKVSGGNELPFHRLTLLKVKPFSRVYFRPYHNGRTAGTFPPEIAAVVKVLVHLKRFEIGGLPYLTG